MTSTLYLAVDIGASRTAAAVARVDGSGAVSTSPFLLGRQSDSIPSVVFVGDGELLFGDAAVRRGLAEPERLISDVKRRVGDGTPIFAGDRRFMPEQLFALLVEWVVEAVTEREGERPAALGITVPASWSERRVDLVTRAIARVGWPDVDTITEPEAAALHYASARSLGAGLLAVYDLGGGTFDAALLRVDARGVLDGARSTVGMEAFGGTDFDDEVLRHVSVAAGLDLAALAHDEDARPALAALRRDVVEAKEALSFDAETTIPVLLQSERTTVRLTRSEFEGMIEDGIDRTADMLAGLVEPAGTEGLVAILLTGGSSRIPRIAQLLSERFDRPIAVDADPKAVVSLGAVRALAEGARASVDAEIVPDAEDAAVAPTFERPPMRNPWFGRAATIAVVAVGALVLSAGIAVAALLPGAGERRAVPEETSPAPAATTIEPARASPTPTPPEPPGPLLTPAPDGVVIDLFPPGGDAPSTPR